MGIAIQAHLDGIQEVKNLFSGVTVARAQERALRAALPIMAQQAQNSAAILVYSKAPNGGKRTREYANSLRIGGSGNVARVDTAGNNIEFGSNVKQAEFLEDGTVPHPIYPKTKKALAFSPAVGRATGVASLRKGAKILPKGQAIFRGKGSNAVSRPGKFSQIVRAHVNHPGTKPLHVLNRAATGIGGEIILMAYINAFAEELERR